MQSALEQVALHCAHEVDTYQECVDAKPSTWQTDCADLKAALNACAAKHSGLVNALKQKFPGLVTDLGTFLDETEWKNEDLSYENFAQVDRVMKLE